MERDIKHTNSNIETAGVKNADGRGVNHSLLVLADASNVASRARGGGSHGVIDALDGAGGDGGEVLGRGNSHKDGSEDDRVLHLVLCFVLTTNVGDWN
jgi:hypothetical protein